MGKWGSIIFLSIFFFGLILFDYYKNHTENIGKQKQTPEAEGGVKQFLSEIHLVKSRGSEKLWDLKALEVQKEKNSNKWRLDFVNTRFFGKNDVIYRVNGDTGFFDDNQKDLKMSGNIRIFSSNGYTLDTSSIHYKSKTHSVVGPEPVELQREAETEKEENSLFVKGASFEAFLETNMISLRKNIYGEKKMSGGRFMKITSNEAIFNGDSKDVLFKDSVIVTVESLVMTGPRARFKYKDNKLHSLFMDENVRINDIKRWGRAGEIEIFFNQDKYTLRGNPKVIQADDHVIGEEIIFFDGGNQIRVKKARTKYNTKDKGDLNF